MLFMLQDAALLEQVLDAAVQNAPLNAQQPPQDMVTPSGLSGLEEAFSADPLGTVHCSEAPLDSEPEAVKDALEGDPQTRQMSEKAMGDISQQRHASEPAHVFERPCEQSKECPAARAAVNE